MIEIIKNDLVVGISTSGNSSNVVQAIEYAKNFGANVVGLTGGNGGAMNKFCDINLVIPSNDTPRIQKMHILIGHTFFPLNRLTLCLIVLTFL